ncbi:MAG: hypothetical protein ABWX94_00380, partial [Candidatus Saccharimonadales bacterium]
GKLTLPQTVELLRPTCDPKYWDIVMESLFWMGIDEQSPRHYDITEHPPRPEEAGVDVAILLNRYAASLPEISPYR